MNIQELFKNVNPEKVFLSYIRRYDIIESYDHRFEVFQEVEVYEKFKEDLFDFIKIVQMAKTDIKTDRTLFVVDLNELDFDDKNKKRFEVFAINNKDIKEKMNKNFSFYGETDNNIDRIGITFSKIETVAGYEIFEKSLNMYGLEAVAAAICHEMQLFDFGRDEEGINNFYESLERSEKDIKEGKTIPADEVFKNLKEKLYADIKDNDTLKYFKEQDIFEEKIKDIKEKWMNAKIKENGKKLIDFIK